MSESSIHIAAQPGEIAETVLLPGDPLRAQFIAQNFLQNSQRYSAVRNMLGFTGTTTDGRNVSVQGAGMGMPSLSIYVHELIRTYGVKRIVRLGSCGSLQEQLKVHDIVLAMGSCSDSALNNRRFQGMSFAPIATPSLLQKAIQNAHVLGIPVSIGNNFSTDLFYDDAEPAAWKLFAQYGVMTIEMESAELYTLAAKYGIEALSILTVSDNLVTGEKLSAEDREQSFTNMFNLALSLVK